MYHDHKDMGIAEGIIDLRTIKSVEIQMKCWCLHEKIRNYIIEKNHKPFIYIASNSDLIMGFKHSY